MATLEQELTKDLQRLSDALAEIGAKVHDAIDEETRRELEAWFTEQQARDAQAQEMLRQSHERRASELRRRFKRY